MATTEPQQPVPAMDLLPQQGLQDAQHRHSQP